MCHASNEIGNDTQTCEIDVHCKLYLMFKAWKNYSLRKALFIKRKTFNLKVFFQAKMVFILGIEWYFAKKGHQGHWVYLIV